MAGTTDVERVRAFNRTWTEVLGLLERNLLETPHSLTEARVLFELGRAPAGMDRLALRERLGIDQSFLGRVLTRLQRADLLAVERDHADGRRQRLRLTTEGRAAQRNLDRRSTRQIEDLLRGLSADQRHRLTESMGMLRAVVRPGSFTAADVEIRGFQPGDLGWVIGRHGAIYAEEYGWNADFEALAAEVLADFHRRRVPGRAEGWIATVAGARAGCILCVERDADTAQLRVLLVEPWARGLGIGRRLVGECIDFARRAGYRKMVLWTNDVLVAARRIYQEAGFVLVREEPHHSFGADLVGQDWELDLTTPWDARLDALATEVRRTARDRRRTSPDRTTEEHTA
jgi:DNA-binding MarR family transcriptional regulator/predicted GNAT family acetyltransferase